MFNIRQEIIANIDQQIGIGRYHLELIKHFDGKTGREIDKVFNKVKQQLLNEKTILESKLK